jgi:hypothetical protein
VDKATRQKLSYLMETTNCSKHYQCLFEPEKTLDESKYLALENLLVCMDNQHFYCRSSINVNSNYMCQCQLRKFLLINIEEISKYT